MTQIGFIGLGHMGQPMAINCLKQYPVLAYDVNPEALANVVQAGATAANTLQEIAENCDVIFTMLQSGTQVQSVCLAKDGLFALAKPNTLFIDCSSIDIQTSRDLNARATLMGLVMVDAPVSGGVVGAVNGALTLMVGGTEDAFNRAKPYLSAVGKNIIHAGNAGNGQIAKICNNMLLGISMIGVSEAFTLAEKLGLAPKTLFEISSKASGQCWSMTSYSPVPDLVPNVPSNNEYKAGFTAAMMLKDLNLAQDAAKLANLQTPMGERARELYEQFVQNQQGDLDFSGIILMLQKFTNS